jgi:hypothetical protein
MGDLTKAMENGCKVSYALLEWSHKEGRIIRIKRYPQEGSTSSNDVEKAMIGINLENL